MNDDQDEKNVLDDQIRRWSAELTALAKQIAGAKGAGARCS